MTRDGPLWLVILAVRTRAGLGAVCRWTLSYFLNPLSQDGRPDSSTSPCGRPSDSAHLYRLDERESRAAARLMAFRYHRASEA